MEKEKANPIGRATGGYLEALLHSCPDAVIAIDAKGTITFVNKATCELMECEMRDLVGKSIVTVYENEKGARETNRKLYLSGGVIHLHESKLRTKKGKIVPARISAAHLKDSSGNYMGGVGFFQAYRPWTAAETEQQGYCRALEVRLAAWEDLGAPVVELWPGLSMAVVMGPLDSQRCEKLKKSLLDHIRVNKTRVALLDLSAALAEDGGVAAQLAKMIRMVRLVGAQCVVVGIESTMMAEAMEPLVQDISSLNTYSSLQAGLEAALSIIGVKICAKGESGKDHG
jgi:PAS domain S-box-containing protein